MKNEQQHEEWLAARRKGVGGSDVAHMFSLPPYGCIRFLFYDKRNQDPDYPRKEGGVLERGKRLEDIVAAQFEKDYGLKTRKVNKILQHKQEKWALANIDRQIIGTGGKPMLLECKTMGREIFHRIKRDGLPEGIILQVQQYLWITGYDKAIIAILWADGWSFVYEEINADPNIHKLIADTGKYFWRMVSEGGIPDRLDPNDRRCSSCIFRTTCQGQLLLDKITDTGDVIVDLSEKLDPLMDELVGIESVIDEANGLKTGITNQIKDIMDKVPVASCTGFRVHYRAHERKTLQSAKLKKDLPEIYNKYVSVGVVRPLRKFPI